MTAIVNPGTLARLLRAKRRSKSEIIPVSRGELFVQTDFERRNGMSASLKGKSVIVTGASKGIGKGIARVFAGHEAKVLSVGRHLKDAEAAAQELSNGGATVSAFAADVTKLSDME